MANAASNAARAMRVRRTGPAVVAAAACRERVLVKDLPPEESWVQVGNHPTGAAPSLSPHNLPTLVRDRARLDDGTRRTAESVEERGTRGSHEAMAFPQTRLR